MQKWKIESQNKSRTWDPSLSVNGRHWEDEVVILFYGLQLKVGGVRAEAVQVEVGVLVAAFGVRIAKLEKTLE